MTEEETFDIYGDDGDVIPSSPSQQSGPKKRLRRERSSSAPPLTKLDDEDDDRSSTPRGKKVKEEEDDDDQDPFAEYDNVRPRESVLQLSLPRDPLLSGWELTCSMGMRGLIRLFLHRNRNRLLWRENLLIRMLLLLCILLIYIGYVEREN
jgi:hypothetical protein